MGQSKCHQASAQRVNKSVSQTNKLSSATLQITLLSIYFNTVLENSSIFKPICHDDGPVYIKAVYLEWDVTKIHMPNILC